LNAFHLRLPDQRHWLSGECRRSRHPELLV